MKTSLYVLGVLAIVSGLIFGFIIMNNAYYEYETYIGIVYIVSGIISGLVFLGFGKVIELLENINNNLSSFNRTTTSKRINRNYNIKGEKENDSSPKYYGSRNK